MRPYNKELRKMYQCIVYPLKRAQARLWLPGLAWVDTFLIGQNTT